MAADIFMKPFPNKVKWSVRRGTSVQLVHTKAQARAAAAVAGGQKNTGWSSVVALHRAEDVKSQSGLLLAEDKHVKKTSLQKVHEATKGQWLHWPQVCKECSSKLA